MTSPLLRALERGPSRPEPRTAGPIVRFNTLWRNHADGWAVASRAYARALSDAGVDVRLAQWLHDPRPLHPDVEAEVGDLARESRDHDVNVFSSALLGADKMVDPLRTLADEPGRRFFYTMFERRWVEPQIVAQLNRLDGVWVPCEENARILRELGCERVRAIPVPFFDHDPHLSLPAPTRVRTFGWIGRLEPRKAPHNLVLAFFRAFSPVEASLVVKTSPVPFHGTYPTVGEMVLEALADPRARSNGWDAANWRGGVEVVSERLDAREMVELHGRFDAYASCSRGEGFDLPAFAAKLSGRRVVSTDSGGPQTFMSARDVTVPATGTVPADPRYVWGPDATYADYDLDAVVEALRRVRREGLPGERPTRRFSSEVVGAELREFLLG